MCDPLTLAIGSFVIGGVSQVASYQAQSAAVEAQNAYADQNAKNALFAFQENQKAITTRQTQEQDAGEAEKFDAGLEAQKAVATERVAAGEAGVSGLSIEAMFRDIYGQTARFNDRVDQNTDWTMAQLQAEKKGDSYRMVDRANAVQKAVKPSFANTGLRILGGGIDSIAGYKKATA